MAVDIICFSINDNIICPGSTYKRNCGVSIVNYIDIFLEALSAERGRSQKTLNSYESDLRLADASIDGGLMGADEQALQSYLSQLPEKQCKLFLILFFCDHFLLIYHS